MSKLQKLNTWYKLSAINDYNKNNIILLMLCYFYWVTFIGQQSFFAGILSSILFMILISFYHNKGQTLMYSHLLREVEEQMIKKAQKRIS